MDWINILLTAFAGIGGISGFYSIYTAKSNKNTIDISNYHQLLEDERQERQLLKKDFEDYKESVNSRVAEVKKEIAEMKDRNDKMRMAIHSAYRCTFPNSVDDCPVISTLNKLECRGCQHNNFEEIDYISRNEAE